MQLEKNKQNMATASDPGVKNKSITGRLNEHFGFRLSADSKTVAMENVCCMHCHLHARLESVSRENTF